MTGEDDSPLYYPCACSGSVEYVHQECLLQLQLKRSPLQNRHQKNFIIKNLM
ncbi:hypothetical protein BDL97_19G096400 [Sphagnum fallax]|nr:hypothetical protein BDL97_19G096400 [Sphagnum fallax]